MGNNGKEEVDLAPKNRLQEGNQTKEKTLPLYTVLEEKGPEHKKMFKVQVSNKEKVLAVGTGSSKKMAEEQAAKNALENM